MRALYNDSYDHTHESDTNPSEPQTGINQVVELQRNTGQSRTFSNQTGLWIYLYSYSFVIYYDAHLSTRILKEWNYPCGKMNWALPGACPTTSSVFLLGRHTTIEHAEVLLQQSNETFLMEMGAFFSVRCVAEESCNQKSKYLQDICSFRLRT